jgi:opacity protein-like surface antigen
MKNIFILVLTFIIMSSAAIAQEAGSKLYIKAGVGVASGINNVGTIGDLINPPDQVDFDFGESTAYQLGMGYLVNDWFTAELSLQRNSVFNLEGPYIDDGIPAGINGKVDLETTSIMLAAQADIASILKKEWKIRPYVGLGVGYAKNKVGKFTISPSEVSNIAGNTKSGFAWKTSFGATYPINKQFIFDVSYSYVDYGEVKSSRFASDEDGIITLNSPLTFDVKTNELLFSIRYLF